MPELPEVETLCLQLQHVIVGEEILCSTVLDVKLAPLEQLAGRRVCAVRRLGKTLAIDLDGAVTLAIHLRMTGGLRWQQTVLDPPSHSRFLMSFPAGNLFLTDPRRFATVRVCATAAAISAAPDPIRDPVLARLRHAAKQKRCPVKSFLLDQRIMAGIGNIYACEILHAAAIHPGREAGGVTPDEWRKVKRAAGSILRKAISCRGTTVSDWRDLFGHAGAYQHRLRVYAREGAPCCRCASSILRIKQGGRGTYFCPSCQM